MKKGFGAWLLVLALVGGAVAWWQYQFPSATFRYKITVTVETPDGLRTGAAVRRIEISSNIAKFVNPDVRSQAYEVQGEAVVVDLGLRGMLMMTVGEDQDFLFKAFPRLQGNDLREEIEYYSQQKDGAVSLLELQRMLPRLVTFRDLKDPKTVAAVDPGDLAASFGAGVRLKDITLEMTDDPVTQGIAGYLPWLEKVRGGYLDGQFSGGGPELSNILYGGNFKAGE